MFEVVWKFKTIVEWQRTRACVPHTPYTSVLKPVPPQVGCVVQPRTRLVEMQATACLNTVIPAQAGIQIVELRQPFSPTGFPCRPVWIPACAGMTDWGHLEEIKRTRPSENGFTVFRRRLRSSESLKQWLERQKPRTCVPRTLLMQATTCLITGYKC